MTTNGLLELQRWYSAQCDGSWEHQYGVKIQTLDNPGWRVSIDLSDTPLADRLFDETKFQGNKEHEWYSCRLNSKVFEGACGPECLDKVLDIFLTWLKGS
jgi:hypothetical protein